MWMLRVCPLSASISYPSHDIALYKETDGKMADDKTRETLLKAVKARDADAIAKTVKEVNESKTAKEKADAEAKARAWIQYCSSFLCCFQEAVRHFAE